MHEAVRGSPEASSSFRQVSALRSCASRRAGAPSNALPMSVVAAVQPSLAAVSARRQTIPVLVNARHPGDQRRIHRLARQDAAGSRDGQRLGRRFAAPDRLLTMRQGALRAFPLRSNLWNGDGRTGHHRPGIRRRASERWQPPTPACLRIAPAPLSAGNSCGSIEEGARWAWLANRRTTLPARRN